jgi:hypothetical protein
MLAKINAQQHTKYSPVFWQQRSGELHLGEPVSATPLAGDPCDLSKPPEAERLLPLVSPASQSAGTVATLAE